MKKTIASLAILASANANALIAPYPDNERPEIKTVCLYVHQHTEADGSGYVGSCDETEKNKMSRREILANGCAEGQVAMKVTKVEVRSCPTYVQL